MANEFIARKGLISKADSTVSGSLNISGSVTGNATGSFSHITGENIFINNIKDHQIGKLLIGYRSSSNPIVQSLGDRIYLYDHLSMKGEIHGDATLVSDLIFSHQRSGYGFQFKTANSGSAVKIDGSGNVGIGTVTPGSRLDIAGVFTFDTTTDLFQITNNTNTGGINLSGNNSRIYFGGRRAIEGAQDGSVLTFGEGYSTVRTAANTDFTVLADQEVRGNLVVGGIVTAQEFHTEFVSASIIYQSGSTKFGDTADDTHNFTGSLQVDRTGAANQLAANFKNRGGNSFIEIESSANKASQLWTNAVGDLGIAAGATAGTLGTFGMYVSASGNVGIGTTTPNHKLQVEGGIKVGSDAGTNLDFDNAGVIVRGSASGNNSYIVLEQQGVVNWRVLNRATSGNFEIAAGSSAGQERLAITTAGNVGIGTTTPTQKLHVNGSIALTDNSALTWSTSSTRIFGQSGYMQLQVAAQDVMRLTSAGNVGIGTISPTDKLHVEYTDNTQEGITIYNKSTANNNSRSRLTLKTQLGHEAFIEKGYSNDFVINNDTKNIRFNQSGSTAMFISSSGNVGIGTTTPAYKFVVDEPTVNNLTVAHFKHQQSSVVSNIILENSAGANNTGFNINFKTGTSGYGGVLGVLRTNEVAAGDADMFLSSGGGEAIRIKHGGNVGIGTTSPSSKLHVSGTADVMLIEGSGSSANTSIFAIDGNNGRLFEVSDDLSDSLFSVNTVAGLPVVEVFADNRVVMGAFNQNDLVISGSKVGIGTATPQYNLQVVGDASVTTWLYVNNIYPTSSTNDLLLNTGTGRTITINPTSTGKTVIPNGNVGIGTTSPLEKLHVAGNVLLNNNQELRWLDSGGTQRRILELTSTDLLELEAPNRIRLNPGGSTAIDLFDGHNTKYTISSVHSFFDSNGAEAVRITGTGNVGIGKTAPTSKLDVAGAVRALGLGSYFGNSATSYSYAVIGAFSNGVDNIPLVAKGYSGQTADLTRWVDSNNNILNVVDASGNVGIGTTSPGYKLDVKSGGTGTYFTSFTPSAGSGFIRIYQDSNSHLSIYGANSAGTTNLVLNTNGVSYLKGGNVIVGGSADNGNTFQVKGNSSITGNLTVDGIVTAQEFHTEFVSASIVYQSGSTKFGDTSDDVHSFTGSIDVVDGPIRHNTTTLGRYIELGHDDGWPALKTDGSVIRVMDRMQIFGRSGARFLDVRDDSALVNALISGNSDTYFAARSGSVGIGTTTPSYRFHVDSGGNETVAYFKSSDNRSRILISDDDTNVYVIAEDGMASLGRNSNLNANNLNVNSSGDVGIGTTNPTLGRLHVVQDSDAVTNGITVEETSGGNTMRLWMDGSTRKINAGGSNTMIEFDTTKVNFPTGNVGIGTTSPTYQLDIYESGSTQPIRTREASTPYRAFEVNYSDTYATQLKFGINGQITYDGNGGRMYITNAGGNVGNNFTQFKMGSTVAMHIAGDGDIGIGTTSPADKLHVVGDVIFGNESIQKGVMTLRGDSPSSDVEIYSIELEREYYNPGVASAKISFFRGGFTQEAEIAFFTQPDNTTGLQERLRINKNGNVGIGTSSPSEKLEVKDGYILVSGSSTSHGFELARDGNDTYQIRHLDGGLTIFNSTDARKEMTFKGDGNVGIGTTSPQADLHVIGNISASNNLYIDNYLYAQGAAFTDPVTIYDTSATENPRLSVGRGGTESLNFDVDDSTAIIYHKQDEVTGYGHYLDIGNWSNGADGSAIRFFSAARDGTSNINHMIISSSGNVGIGTTTPGYALDIQGDLNVNHSANVVALRIAGIAALGRGLSTDGTRINGGSTDGIEFTPNNDATIKMVIKPDGDVGIGTTTPSQKLTVQGNISASGDLYSNAIRTVNNGNIKLIPDGTGNLYFGNAGKGMNVYHYSSANDGKYAIWSHIGSRYQLSPGQSEGFWINSDARILGDLTVDGIVTAQEFHTEFVSASIIYQSGSTKFGDTSDDIHQFTGSIYTSGSLEVNAGTATPFIKGDAFRVAGQTNGAFGKLTLGTINHLQGDVGNFKFLNNTTSLMYISGSGNVGIGTNTPSQKLEVDGNIKATKLLLNTTNTGYTLYSNGESRINGVTFQQISSTDYLSKSSGTGDFYVRNSVSGENIFVGAANSSGQFTNYLQVDGANNDATIRTNDVDRLYISSSGNIGIGTTSPTRTVEIGTDGGGENILKMHSDTASSYFEIQSIGNVARLLATNNTNLLLQSDGAGGYITFNANSGERMRIDPAGRLLINSTSTSFSDKLYINGDAYANGGWRVGTSGTYVGKLYNSNGVLSLESDSTRDIQFGSVANGTAMYIEGSNGNVGIGTNNPTGSLHVSSTSNIVTLQDSNSSYPTATNYISFRDNGTQGEMGTIGYISDGNLSITQNNPTKNILLTGANVGIGTTSPSYKLTVSDGTIGSELTAVNNYLARRVDLTSANASGLGAFTYYNTNTDATPDFMGKYGFTFYGGTSTSAKQYQLFVGDAVNPRMVLNAQGYMGLGTTAPSKALDIVAGNGLQFRITSTRSDNTLKNAYINLMHYDNSEEDFTMILGNSDTTTNTLSIGGGTSIGNAATTQRFYTAANSTTLIGTERMRIASDGNIGINVTNPQYKLHVDGDVYVSEGLNVKAPTTSSYAVYVADPVGSNRGGIYLDSSGNTEFLGRTSSGTTVSLKASGTSYLGGGNLGLGKTSANYPLDIDSDNTSAAIRVRQHTSSGYAPASIALEATSAGSRGQGIYMHNSVSDTNWFAGTLYNIDNQGYGIAFYPNAALSTLTAQTSYTKLFVSSSGNVGIGTTSPAYTLDVTGDIRVTDDMFVNDDLTVGSAGNGQILVGSIGYLSGASTSIFDIYTPGNLRFNADSNDNGNGYISFEESGDEKMRITHQGYVGIGTTSPAGPFQSYISATRYIGHNVNNGDLSVVSDNNSAPVFKVQGTGTADLVNIFDNTTEVFTIRDGGNVGIGTTGPQKPLHVQSANDAPIRVESTDATTGILFADPNNSNALYYVGSGDAFYTSAKLGIGQAPSRDLHVKKANSGGQVRMEVFNSSNTANSHGIVSIYSGGASGGDPFLHWKIDVQQDWSMGIDNSDGDKLKISKNFGPGVNDYMTFDTSGNVGIGTTSPSEELDVNGTVQATLFVETSARRFKENIEPIEGALDKISNLQGVTFNRIGEEKREYGFIADEVKDIVPELVTHNADGDVQGVHYARTVAILTEAVKELDNKVKAQDLFIKDLVARIEKLENK